MSQFVSRLLVTIVGVPVVLGSSGSAAGGSSASRSSRRWSRCTSSTRWRAGCGRSCLAGYAGALATLLGAQLGGPAWMLGGFVLTLLLAFLLYGIAETRQTATVTMSSTVLGTAWIALGLGHLLLLRATSRARPPDRPHGAARRLRRRHGRLPRRPRDRPAQARAGALAGQDLGGLLRRHDRGRRGLVLRPLRGARRRSSRSGRRSCSAA